VWRYAGQLIFVVAALFSGPATADDAAVARGAYLATASGCDQCHTDGDHHGAPYAGGRLLQTEFGAIAAPNITPDRATGIGGWSLSDFVRAMRWGIAPDGTHYTTAFPFPYFARLTDADLADLKAFLDSVAPVSQAEGGRAAGLALFTRARAAADAALAPNLATPPAAPTDSQLARGAYLVDAVGRCGDCHTPRSWIGLPDATRKLAGSTGWLTGKKAPNITPDAKTGIGDWTEDDILDLLNDGQTPDGDFVGGAMAEIVRNTARLTDADRRAIAAYLRALPAKTFDKNN
jgi:mono/diheme cytochrome c family protein